MENRVFSAYNLARGVLLNSKLAVADTGNQPLKLLDIVISGIGMDPTSGLWLTPLHAVPAVPRVFPFDLIYLDKEYRVIEIAEMGPGIDFPAFSAEIASALVIPSETLRHTQTEPGDRLIVCVASELEVLLATSSGSVMIQASNGPSSTPVSPGTDWDTPHQSALKAAAKDPANRTAYDASGFEHSILTAVAKASFPDALPAPSIQSHTAQTPNCDSQPRTAEAHLPNSVSEIRSGSQGPSMAVTEAVFDRRGQTGAAIVEHHVDPEDLFSNWVVSPPPPPPPSSRRPPKPPKLERTSAEDSPAEIKAAVASARKERPSKPAPSDHAPPPEAPASSIHVGESPEPPSQKIPQLAPASTFTAAGYGLWQVSLPTAIQPVPAHSGRLSSPPSVPTGGNGAKQSSVTAKSAPPAETPEAEDSRSASSGTPQSTPRPKTETAPAVSKSSGPIEKEQVSAPDRSGASRLAASQTPLAARSVTTDPEAAVLTPRSSSRSDATPIAPTSSRTKLAVKPKATVTGSLPQAPTTSSLRSRFKQWLNPVVTPSDRRRDSRRYVPGMVAHYFTGGAPKPHDIADISLTGMYILTDDRWMPGTMIQMTLQKPCARGERKQSMNVLSRIVRRGSDGVAIEFVMPDALSHIGHDIQPSQATDRFALARFL